MVKPGYKQSEIGVIPEDWDCVRLGEKVKIYRGGSPRPIQDYITTSSDGVNWIKIGDVGENDKYIRSTQEKITPEGISKSREVHIGDFILSNSMSFGRPYILDIDGCIHDGWLTIQDYKNTFSTEYLYYLLSSDLVYQQCIGMAAGSSVKNLNKDKVSALYVIYPAVSEQERIAEALSDVDDLIFSLEKLIEKYKSIKVTCLQQMFPQKGETTPKMRLPGFTGAWEQRKWSNTVDISTDMVDPKTGLYDELPHVAPGNIESFTGRLFDNVKLVKDENLISGKFRFSAGDIIYGKINPQLGKYVFAAFSGLTSADAYVLNAKNGIDQKFLYAVLQTKDFFDYSVSVSKRSGMPKINRDELNAYSFAAPSTAEQAKIGSFLLGIDNLITLHQRKLNKTKKIKQGMMQQLLTGKIRLV